MAKQITKFFAVDGTEFLTEAEANAYDSRYSRLGVWLREPSAELTVADTEGYSVYVPPADLEDWLVKHSAALKDLL